RIAISRADQSAFTGYFEGDLIVGCGHVATVFVKNFDTYDGYIFAIGINRCSISCELDGLGIACRLALFGQHDFAILAAASFDHAGLVFHLPLEMRIGLDFLAAQAPAVEKELDLVQVRMYPN